MQMPVNAFKQAIEAGRQQIGLWSSLGSATVAEVLAGAGYDWILIDTEHSPSELAEVLDQLRAMARDTVTPVVRPAWNDPVLIKKYLDIGAQTLLLPFVQNAADAASAVAAVRYPPVGRRGVAMSHRANNYGRISDYFEKVHERLCLLVQLESESALSEIEAIARVDGVDAVFIGPSDLAADLGHLGDSEHQSVQQVIAETCIACERIGIPAGILAANESVARRYLDMGFTFVAVGIDTGLLRHAAETVLANIRKG